MAEMPPDVLKNVVMALHVPLTADELDKISWLAKAKRAALLDLPIPIRPGFWAKVKKFFLKVYSAWLDRKAFTKAIGEQADRICMLEDLLDENRVDIPGGRSDE